MTSSRLKPPKTKPPSSSFALMDTEPSTPPKISVPLQSTPVKIESCTLVPFTTNQKYRIESCTTMGEEIKKYLVGPMPPQNFLDIFFPVSELTGLESVPLFTVGCYHATVNAQREKNSYGHFVSLLTKFPLSLLITLLLLKINSTRNYAPNLLIVNSSSAINCNPCSDFSFKIKPDVSVYCANVNPTVKTDSSLAEIFIKFKWN